MTRQAELKLSVTITERVPLEADGRPPCRIVIGAAIGEMFEVGEIVHPVGHPPNDAIVADEHAKLVGRLVARHLRGGQ